MTDTSIEASEQHVSLMVRKRRLLGQRLQESVEQYLFAVRRAWDAGEITWHELLRIYNLINDEEIPRRGILWRDSGLPNHQKIKWQVQNMPDPALGYWWGQWPYTGEPYPTHGESVVYALMDSELTPIYVGSTNRFHHRLRQHAKGGKVWTYWVAHPCSDREEAYQLEERFLRGHLPKLNKKVGR